MQPDNPLKNYEHVTPAPVSAPAGTPPPSKPRPTIIRWWIEEDKSVYFWLFLLLLVATVGLFIYSKPPRLSPLIASYLDLLDQRSAWAIPAIVSDRGWSFELSRAFVVTLSLFLCVTYLLCQGSFVVDAPEEEMKEVPKDQKFVAVTEPGKVDPLRLQTRYFGLGNLASNSRGLWFVGALFLVMAVSNYHLFSYFRVQLETPGVPQSGWGFHITYFVAILSRLFGVFIGIGALLQLFLEDFGAGIVDFWRSYWNYFYPPLLAIAVVAFIFTRMDQFDGLFIDLIESWPNFLLFCVLLFPASIIIIWFTPAYLVFTDRQFANRQDSWDIVSRLVEVKNGTDGTRRPNFLVRLWRIFLALISPVRRFVHRVLGMGRPTPWKPGFYWWMVFHKRLFPQLDVLEDEVPDTHFMPGAIRRVDYPTDNFHRFRAFLGITYILCLVSICAEIYFGNKAVENSTAGVVVGLTFFGVLGYIISALRVSNIAHREGVTAPREYPMVDAPELLGWLAALRERGRVKRKSDGTLEEKTKDDVVVVTRSWPFWLGVGSLLLAGITFVVTFLNIVWEGVSWEVRFFWFLAFLVCSVFAFAWLALFQPFFKGYSFNGENENGLPTDAFMDRIDHLTTQVMLLFNPLIAGLALVFFIFGLLSEDWVSSSFVSGLNPLNIYLLLINGLIAGIILFDRYLLLRDRRMQYLDVKGRVSHTGRRSRIASSNIFWGLAIVGVLLATNYLGNSYHEIQYQPLTAVAGRAPTLREYTTNFVQDTSQKGPVIFIAADGGGLKACYWTMLNLLYLDQQGLYDGQVFALSGASGGTIGLSMYNYLKAQNKDTAQIRDYITRIGSGNYLSGDFAGLLTRFPINYWPDLPGIEPHQWDDRMEGMARSYFRVVGDGGEGYDYESIRHQPFWKPWADNPSLPLLIINTARAEDGLLGTVMPLADNPLAGTIKLTYDQKGNAISYPDATFLSNRFPLASPAARITGKGHFLDAGSADNSGLNSLYSLLRTLKAESLDTSKAGAPFRRVFDRGVVVISLRNAASRYVRDEFLWALDSLNRYPYKSELSANTGVAVNTGLTGVPINWDDYLRGEVPVKLGLINQYLTIDLPFRLRRGDVYSALGGELRLPNLAHNRDSLNYAINTHLGQDSSFAVMPPLGRLLAEPVRRYMDRMVSYPKIIKEYDRIKPQ